MNEIVVHFTNNRDIKFNVEEIPDLVNYFSAEIDINKYFKDDSELSDDEQIFLRINKLILFDLCNRVIPNMHWILDVSPQEISLVDYYDILFLVSEMLEKIINDNY